MSDQTNETVRIDYLKFFLRLEWDRAEIELGKILGYVHNPQTGLVEDDNFKLTALGADLTGDGKRRYVVEAWGPQAHELADIVPAYFWESCARVDVRLPLKDTLAREVDAYVDAAARGAKSRRNVTTFNTKFRRKTNSRDVGGRGVLFGSRKSDTHTVIYRRGDETPALETRHQGPRARDIGLVVCQMMDENPELLPRQALMAAGVDAMYKEMYAATGCTTTLALQLSMTHAARQAVFMERAAQWAETEFEQAYWEGLTPEHQENEQRERWTPSDVAKSKPVKNIDGTYHTAPEFKPLTELPDPSDQMPQIED